MFLPRAALTLQWWEWNGKSRSMSPAGNLSNLQEVEDAGEFTEEISLDFVKKRDDDLISCLRVSARALLFLDLCCPLVASTVYQARRQSVQTLHIHVIRSSKQSGSVPPIMLSAFHEACMQNPFLLSHTVGQTDPLTSEGSHSPETAGKEPNPVLAWALDICYLSNP